MGIPGNQTAAWTVARLLAWTQDHLRRAGLESARLCAEILLAHAMGCERLRLYTRYDEAPIPEVLARFRKLVRQAGTGRPIAYLTGQKEFFALSFEVTPDVLIPRPETEILVERTISLVRKQASGERNGETPAQPALLDLGTGSGCIAVSLARHLPAARIYASDISEPALAVARRNAARHTVDTRIEFRPGDLLEPWGRPGAAASFDVIVCNPPYVATAGPVEPAVRDYEPRAALFAGVDGLDVIRRVLQDAPARLVAGGHLLLEMGYDHGGPVRELAAGGPWRDVTTYRDGGGHERVLHARRSDKVKT